MENIIKEDSKIDKNEENENNKTKNYPNILNNNPEDYNKNEKSTDDTTSNSVNNNPSNNYLYKSNNSPSSFPLLFK